MITRAAITSYPIAAMPGGVGFVEFGAAGAAGSLSAWAIPAIGAGIAVATKVFGWIQRRGQRKVAATQIVDEAEGYLIENLEAYQSGARTADDQARAMQVFDAVWSEVRRACSDPALGDPGRRCISERERGGQWDWFARYLDPIAADTPTAAPGQFFVAPGTNPVSVPSLALPALLIVVGLML